MPRHIIVLMFVAIFPIASGAGMSIEDDFNDGDADGWYYRGVNSSLWNVAGGELQSASTQTNHVRRAEGPSPGAALHENFTTITHFSLEADIRVIGTPPNLGTDNGHVGFVWGYIDNNNSNYVYLRTHNDEVTSFGHPEVNEHLLDFPNAQNDVSYHLKLEVDYSAKVMTVTLDNASVTFTGTDFDEINVQSVGGVGLITWGERVGYDNVVFKDLSEDFINAGLNDAWFNAATAGQGFFIIVFPEIGQVFLSWFTYDTERPAEGIEATLGDPGHRWLTAQGFYSGNQAILDVVFTSGGVFDSSDPPVENLRPYGTITIVWHDCKNATLNYEIPLLGLMGSIELTRIALDNVALCEALSSG